MAGGVEYQVTKVDPTDPHTKGMVYQVHQVSEEIAATLGGKVYRARIINDPTAPIVAGKVYQIVLIGDPSAPAVKGKVYNAILTGDTEAVVVGPAVSPLSLPDAIANSLQYVKAFGGTEQRNLPTGYTQLEYIESTGTQYIDTGYAPTLNTNSMKAQIKLSCLSYKTIQDKNPFVFGSSTLVDSLRRYNRIGLLNNNFVYTITTNGSREIDTNISPVLGTVYDTEYSINFGTSASLKILNGSTVVVNDTQTGNMQRSTESYYLFAINHTVAADGVRETVARVYSCKVYDNDTLVRDFIPAKRNSDNVIGMYDIVNDVFYTNAGTGTFLAGGEAVPTPDTPMDIVSNNGALKVRHQSGLPLGYTLLDSIESTGTQYIDTGVVGNVNTAYEITVKTNEHNFNYAYVVFGSRESAAQNNISCCYTYNSTLHTLTAVQQFGDYRVSNQAVTATGSFIGQKLTFINSKESRSIYNWESQQTDTVATTYSGFLTTPTNLYIGYAGSIGGLGTPSNFIGNIYSCKIWDNGTLVRDLIPAKNSSNVVGMYDLVSGTFFTNAGTGTFTAGADIDDVEVYADGTVETIKDTLNNTATCEDLLSVGNFTDVQSIIDGEVTRNVGVKVLDGTENWVRDTYYPRFKLTLQPDSIVQPNGSRSIPTYCTHFKMLSNGEPIGAVTPNQGYVIRIEAGTESILFLHNNMTDAEQFKQWLAAQYANGTPVIIVYPLATPTTESVAGQTMQVQAGDNYLEITQASLNGLELEAKYEKTV